MSEEQIKSAFEAKYSSSAEDPACAEELRLFRDGWLARAPDAGEAEADEEAAFEQLCREHEIAGTVAARQCEVFWRAGAAFRATHGQQYAKEGESAGCAACVTCGAPARDPHQFDCPLLYAATTEPVTQISTAEFNELLEAAQDSLAAPSHPPATVRPEFAQFVDTPEKRFLYDWGRRDGYQDGYAAAITSESATEVKEPAVAVQAEPVRKVIGYTWTDGTGRIRHIGAAPHATQAHNIEPVYYPLAAHSKPAAQSEGRPCALCGDKARIPPTCDACHDSMGTKPKPAAPATADEAVSAPFGRDGENAPEWLRKRAQDIGNNYGTQKGRAKAHKAEIIEAMQDAAILALRSGASAQHAEGGTDLIRAAMEKADFTYQPTKFAQALIDEMCDRIKAADDEASKADYMLDSDDCISVLRGTWTAKEQPHDR